MAKTQDYSKVMKDFMGAFPVDMTAVQDALKTQASFGEKLSKVALEAADKSAEISNKWTKDTIEQPAKQEKYQKSFTLYVEGDQVYAREKADALETELQPLVGGPLITHMSKLDTNPANSPQMPARYQK